LKYLRQIAVAVISHCGAGGSIVTVYNYDENKE